MHSVRFIRIILGLLGADRPGLPSRSSLPRRRLVLATEIDVLERRTLLSTISDSAYGLLDARATANQSVFTVYEDEDSAFDSGYPSGFFADSNATLAKIHLDTGAIDDPNTPDGTATDPNRLDRSRGNVLKIAFDPLGVGQFAGVNIEEPENWGTNRLGTGYDLRGATKVVFDVRSPTPGGIMVQFGVGGSPGPFVHIPQSLTFSTMTISLDSLGLSQADLADVHILFSMATNNAPSGGTLLLDNIRFEPVPTSQQGALSFPIGTQTFGVVPLSNPSSSRVPFPPDQVLRNLTTIYESSLTLIALLNRGTSADLSDARRIADTFVYALSHDNHGIPLPTAPDGSTGLHNGYEGGDLALHNAQQPPKLGQAGDDRLAGFSTSTQLAGPSGFALVLDGATGGNNAFAILALTDAYRRFADPRYLQAAETIGHWIIGNLADTSGTGYGGFFLGYPDEGKPKVLQTGKSIENNADIFAAFTALAGAERSLGQNASADFFEAQANIAGDFVMALFDPAEGRFFAGTVPVGTSAGPGIAPSGSQRGNDVINTFDFLDSNTFTTLALAASPRYRDRLDWNLPIQFVLDHFSRSITAAGLTYQGLNIAEQPVSGPDGIAWEFTGQAVTAMQFVDDLYGEERFEGAANFYLAQIRQAQQTAPFGDGQGVVASTLQGGDLLPPIEQALSTPFQEIPERVGLASSTWAIFAAQNRNVFEVSSNTSPVLAPIADVTVNEGSPLALTATATDPDVGQYLRFSLGPNAPAGMAIDPVSGGLTWTPADGPASVRVTVRVDDDGSPNLNDTKSFIITVRNVAPTVSVGGDETLLQGDTLSRAGSFHDPGAETWTASVNYGDNSGLQPLALNPDGSFRLQHVYGEAGTFTVTVVVADKDGGVGVGTFAVNVSPQRDITPPFVAAFSAVKKRGVLTKIVVTFSEPMDSGVTTLGFYRLVGASRDRRFGTKDDRILQLRLVSYDPATRTATLAPKDQVRLNQPLRLVIKALGIHDQAGNVLDGDRDGKPGGDFIGQFGTRPRAPVFTAGISKSSIAGGHSFVRSGRRA